MKNALIWTGSVIGVGAVLALIFGVLDNPEPKREISVVGECLTTAPKDRTAITLRVTTLDKSAATSMRMATEKITAITEFLKTQNVQMQTTEFNSYERSEWNRELEKSVVLGTETTIAIEVSADNIETIEKILTQFAGQEDIYSENLRMYTSAEAMKPILENCLATAVENAHERAVALASGAGDSVGQMLRASYSVGGSSSIQPRASNFLSASTKMAVADAEAFSAAGSIVAKDTEVSVSVSATFEIK